MNFRLDKYVAEKFPDFSRTQIQKFVKKGFVLVNGLKAKAGHILKAGDKVEIQKFKQPKAKLSSNDMDLKILYEDKSCFVVDKPAGVVVHPSRGHEAGTIANAILRKLDGSVGSIERPGIVHRLDKDTSGILVIAKTQKAYLNLIKQFEKKTIEKRYLALLSGNMKYAEGVVDAPIGRSPQNRKKMSVRLEGYGKNAISNYKILKSYKVGQFVVNLVEVKILTGRTHQIRVHMAALGNPVVGDGVYGKKSVNDFFAQEYSLKRQFLHAAELKFVSPESKKEVKIQLKLPEDLGAILEKI